MNEKPKVENIDNVRYTRMRFDETEKVYIDKPNCLCFVRVDYWTGPKVGLEKGHMQWTLGEIFNLEPGKEYWVEIEEV